MRSPDLALLLRTLTSSSSACASSSRPSRLAPDAPEAASSRFSDAIVFKSSSVKYVVGFAEFIGVFRFARGTELLSCMPVVGVIYFSLLQGNDAATCRRSVAMQNSP